jgi:hypothetical protein
MVMPYCSERRPEQQHEECDRDQDTQGSLWVRHFWGAIPGPQNTVRISVVQNPSFRDI